MELTIPETLMLIEAVQTMIHVAEGDMKMNEALAWRKILQKLENHEKEGRK